MEPWIELLLGEVPEDFVPTFTPKGEVGRIVGAIDDLDADTRRIIVGVFYFLALDDAVDEAHKLEHQLPDFQEDGEECTTAAWLRKEYRQRIIALQEAADPLLQGKFALNPGELLDIRAEGIVAVPPEPEDPVETLLRSLGYNVIGPVGFGV